MASTDATFKAAKRYGRLVGIRTRRNVSTSPAAYERISSRDSGRTDVRPRSVLTSTGKKQRSAATAMIEIAFAAIRYGMSAFPSGRQRANPSATRNADEQPIAKPPSASLKVIQA